MTKYSVEQKTILDRSILAFLASIKLPKLDFTGNMLRLKELKFRFLLYKLQQAPVISSEQVNKFKDRNTSLYRCLKKLENKPAPSVKERILTVKQLQKACKMDSKYDYIKQLTLKEKKLLLLLLKKREQRERKILLEKAYFYRHIPLSRNKKREKIVLRHNLVR